MCCSWKHIDILTTKIPVVVSFRNGALLSLHWHVRLTLSHVPLFTQGSLMKGGVGEGVKGEREEMRGGEGGEGGDERGEGERGR